MSALWKGFKEGFVTMAGYSISLWIIVCILSSIWGFICGLTGWDILPSWWPRQTPAMIANAHGALNLSIGQWSWLISLVLAVVVGAVITLIKVQIERRRGADSSQSTTASGGGERGPQS